MSNAEILLEAGTNELEIMSIDVGGVAFGVNVAKVREVIPPLQVHKLHKVHESIEGFIELRGKVIELIDLRRYLGMGMFTDEERNSPTGSQILVTEFNKVVVGFRVNSIITIQRAGWESISSVPAALESSDSPLVGIAVLGDRIVQMLDLENIMFRLNPGMQMSNTGIQSVAERAGVRIVFADDSKAVRAKIQETLEMAGFVDIEIFTNGLDAWNYVESCAANELPHIVISDIEMPLMDGLSLCKKIRNQPQTAEIPVILFSSLVNDRTRNKGDQVGATRQISKPELSRVVDLTDELLGIQA